MIVTPQPKTFIQNEQDENNALKTRYLISSEIRLFFEVQGITRAYMQ